MCVCVRETKKESQNDGRSQRHMMAESQNGGHNLLEGEVTECSVKGLQKWSNMTWGSHILKTTTLAGKHKFRNYDSGFAESCTWNSKMMDVNTSPKGSLWNKCEHIRCYSIRIILVSV